MPLKTEPQRMKFFELNDSNENDFLSQLVDNYQIECNEGNYEIDDELEATMDEQINFIKQRLNESNLGDLFSNVKKERCTFGQIINLCVACYIYDNPSMDKKEVTHMAEAGIPTACIIHYQKIIVDDSISHRSKCWITFNMVRRLLEHSEVHGYYAHRVADILLKKWESMVDPRNYENWLDDKLKFESMIKSDATMTSLDEIICTILQKIDPQLILFI